MRRNYISPEFVNSKIYGSFNSYEESNFFGSKMLEIEDLVDIIDQNVIYYQNSKNEQIDVDVESAQNSVIYSSFDNKKQNHTLIIDDSQSDIQRKSNTRWILDIDLKSILTEFIFANLKRERTFQSLTNDMVVSKDVNVFIRNYISNNVLDRYNLSNIELYVDYLDLKSEDNFQYKNTFDKRTFNKISRFQTETNYNSTKTRLTFNQEQTSQDWTFKYSFNLKFVKI
jgi:hypothetical protein|tara:strand:+ start:895 stop:1575 length:681 start_codon:yes stop_codon:yes gene_type:complete